MFFSREVGTWPLISKFFQLGQADDFPLSNEIYSQPAAYCVNIVCSVAIMMINALQEVFILREMIYFAQKWKTLYSLFVGVLQFPTLCFRFFIGLRLLCHIYYYRRIFKKKYLKLSFLITFSFLIKEFGDVVIFFIRPSMNFFYSL